MTRHLLPTLLSASLICAVHGGGGWTKYEKNPVLGSPELGTCFDVNVIAKGSAKYNMYFSWRPMKAIALVRSNDGVKWTEPEICLRHDETSGWEDNLNRSCTIFWNGEYHMWYTGQARGYSKIGYAKSKDGVHFTRVVQHPVLISERPHEGFSVMNPYVMRDDARGVFRMWYASGETYEPNVLCYAESKDGIVWEKSLLNPIFVHGSGNAWDKDRVGGCEVYQLKDGRYVMFYIGYSDIHTARIGAAISPDGIRCWKRLKGNPLVEPVPGEWDSAACYKPSAVWDEEGDCWRLWYNGRTGSREYIGMAVHKGYDLGPVEGSAYRVIDENQIRRHMERFSFDDNELYPHDIRNNAACWWSLSNIPRFDCPDADLVRTYYFRWWTYRKHLRRTKDGGWVVTEFLPDVGWAGADNTIACPFGHHVREGRWLRNRVYVDCYIAHMLAKGNISGPRAYANWPAWSAWERAKVTGDFAFPRKHLAEFAQNWETWAKGWTIKGLSLKDVENKQGAKGVPIQTGFREDRGLFDFAGDREGSEFALSSDGARPMVNAAMWAEATAIAELARASGDAALAERTSRIGSGTRRSRSSARGPSRASWTTCASCTATPPSTSGCRSEPSTPPRGSRFWRKQALRRRRVSRSQRAIRLGSTCPTTFRATSASGTARAGPTPRPLRSPHFTRRCSLARTYRPRAPTSRDSSSSMPPSTCACARTARQSRGSTRTSIRSLANGWRGRS